MSSAPYLLQLHDCDKPNRVEWRVDKPASERIDSPCIGQVTSRWNPEWHWLGWVPFETVTVIEGAAGAGKTRLVLDLAATSASGAPFPDGAPNLWPGHDVLLISRHEQEASRVAAQFQPARSDSGKLYRFSEFSTSAPESEQYGQRPVAFPFDLEALNFHLEEHNSIGLVIIDSLADFCPTPKLFAETLHQLNALAARCKIAIIVTAPANCRIDREGRLKVTSRWPTEAARWVWSIIPDPDDPSRRLLAARRTNLCREPDGLAFRLTDDGVEWEADSKVSAVDPAGHLTACQFALQELLRGGALPAATVYRLGAEMGYSPKELRAAAKRVGAGSARVGFGGNGRWLWALPAEQGTEAARLVRDFSARILPVESHALAGVDAGETAMDNEGPVFERDGRFEYLPLIPAAQHIPAAAEAAAGKPDGVPHVGCVKLAQDEGVSAQAAFGAGNTPSMCDTPPASDDAPMPGLARHTLPVGEQCEPLPGDPGVDRESPIDQRPGHARPLSKRKAKKARRKLARMRAAERVVVAGVSDELVAASSGIPDVFDGRSQ
jgi:hypothetical protein